MYKKVNRKKQKLLEKAPDEYIINEAIFSQPIFRLKLDNAQNILSKKDNQQLEGLNRNSKANHLYISHVSWYTTTVLYFT